jgi:hypothetical protein
MMPTMMQTSTSSSIGRRIQCGGSCGVLSAVGRLGAEEHAVDEAERIGDGEGGGEHRRDRAGCCRGPASDSCGRERLGEEHLLRDEAVEQRHAGHRAAGHHGEPRGEGHEPEQPGQRRMSRVPVSWSMMPAAMNSDALNAAWLTMWKIAATAPAAARPSSSVMRPRWLMVE